MVDVEYALLAGTRVFVHGEAYHLDNKPLTIAKPLGGGPLFISRLWAHRPGDHDGHRLLHHLTRTLPATSRKGASPLSVV
jgi:hypothetical protein